MDRRVERRVSMSRRVRGRERKSTLHRDESGVRRKTALGLRRRPSRREQVLARVEQLVGLTAKRDATLSSVSFLGRTSWAGVARLPSKDPGRGGVTGRSLRECRNDKHVSATLGGRGEGFDSVICRDGYGIQGRSVWAWRAFQGLQD